ncbi:hypothetical protein MMC26_001166 [Xylographa opegraphella]|nr:hypothetical protein [Xylographa opegraphella]
MQRRDSLAQWTRRRLTNALGLLTRRNGAAQGLLETSQQLQDQLHEQEQLDRRQHEQLLQRRRLRQLHAHFLRDEPEHASLSVDDTASETTHISRYHDAVTQTTDIRIYRDEGIQASESLNCRDTLTEPDSIPVCHSSDSQTENFPTVDDMPPMAKVSTAEQYQIGTNEEIDQIPPAAAIDHETVEAIQSQDEQKAGRVVVVADRTTGLPMLLLTHRLVHIMNLIRSRDGNVEALTKKLTRICREENTTEQSVSQIEEELGNEDVLEEQRTLLEQRKADAASASEERRKKMISVYDEEVSETRDLKHLREQFLSTIERALSEANILDPIQETTDESGVEQQQEGHGTKTTAGPQTLESKNSNSGGGDETEPENRTALDVLDDARQLLDERQEMFDNRGNMYDTDMQEYRQALAAGTTSIKTTVFDQAYFQNVSWLTACLREAEEGYANAFNEAQRLGLVVEPDDSEGSYLASWSSDGYRMSQEAELHATVPAGKIMKWREQASISSNVEPADLGSQQPLLEQSDTNEFDEWEAKSIGTAESWDAQERKRRLEAIDTDPNPFYRKRIDRWREEMDHIRTEWFNNHPPTESGDSSD